MSDAPLPADGIATQEEKEEVVTRVEPLSSAPQDGDLPQSGEGAQSPLTEEHGPWDNDDDDYREPWCKDFEAHKAAHEFCSDHQSLWCRLCDRGCPDCVDDPHCPDCHCSLFEDEHDWDCSYAGEDDDDD